MKTLYKFGFKLNEDESLWATVFFKLFEIDVRNEKINTKPDKKEKRWLETYKNLSVFREKRNFCGHKLERIYLSFNRYQEYVYLTLLFDEAIESFDIIREKIKKDMFDNSKDKNESSYFIDNFEIPFKEADLYAEYDDSSKYIETISLGNPVYIKDQNSDVENPYDSYLSSNHKELNLSNLTIKYNIQYSSKQNNNYNRFLNQIYVVDSFENSSLAIEHFHSIFVLFHRAYSHYTELSKMDSCMQTMVLLSDKLNEIWPKERIKLFLINRFIHARLYNKTFYVYKDRKHLIK